MAVAVTVGTAENRVVATTRTEPTFLRGRHLGFAVMGLAHAPMVGATWPIVMRVTNSRTWSAELAALNVSTQLCFAAFVAWLAFAMFDTNAGVTIWPKRWRDIGWPLAAWCVVQETYLAASIWTWPTEHLLANERWLATFSVFGDLRFGWLTACMLAAATAEEIVYRALLLRALEGYMRPIIALVVQAIAFELVHAYVYGSGGITGTWFIGGLVLGYAFQRTRSLAVPTMLHSAHNTLFLTMVWYFNQ
jgi:membrane protease YdiL (CAAX protease family)